MRKAIAEEGFDFLFKTSIDGEVDEEGSSSWKPIEMIVSSQEKDGYKH